MSYPETNGTHEVPKLDFDVPLPKPVLQTARDDDAMEVPIDAHTDKHFCVEHYQTDDGFTRVRVFGPFESERECDAFTSFRSDLLGQTGLSGIVASVQQIDPAKLIRVEFTQKGGHPDAEAVERAEGPFTLTYVKDGAKPETLGSFGPFDTHAQAKSFMTGERGRATVRRLGATNCFIDAVITNLVAAAPPTGVPPYLVVSTRRTEGKVVSRHAYGFFGSWDEANDFALNKLPGGSLQPGQTLSINIVEPPG